jgi:hypothetical protein
MPTSSDARAAIRIMIESARRGDINSAAEIAGDLRNHDLPQSAAELRTYLEELREAKTAVRVWRSHATASVQRLQAAARFQSAIRPNSRQFSVITTEI